MEELKIAVQSALGNIIGSGEIEQIIEGQLKKTIESIVSDQLRAYSDFGKALEKKIHEDLKYDLNNISFAEHNKTVLNMIEGLVNQSVTESAREKFKEDIQKLFGPAPERVTLTEIIDKFKEENADECGCSNPERIGLIIEEKEYGYIGVGLHPEHTKGYRNEMISSWQDCELYLSVNMDKSKENEGILSYTADNSSLRAHAFMPTCLHGVSRLLYQMYCKGSVFVFDQGVYAEGYDTFYNGD